MNVFEKSVTTLAAALLVGSLAATPSRGQERKPIPIPPAPIEVRVLGTDGEPVAGVTVNTVASSVAKAEAERLGRRSRRSDWFDLHRSRGVIAETDERGVVYIEWTEGGFSAMATRPGEFAWKGIGTPDEAPLLLELARDYDIDVHVVGADEVPRANVDIVLYRVFKSELDDEDFRIEEQIYSPLGQVWTDRTSGPQGSLRIEHAQLWFTQPDMLAYRLGLGIPLSEFQLVSLDPENPPKEPIVMKLPATGRLVCEMAEAPGALVQVRRLPDEDPSDHRLRGEASWWPRDAPVIETFAEGRATIPYVELGLRLQIEARWEGMVSPVRKIVDGPRLAGQEIVVRFEGREGPGGVHVVPAKALILKGVAEVEPPSLSLCAIDPENERFQLCVGLEDRDDDDLTLLFEGEKQRARTTHSGEAKGVWHRGFEIESRERAEALALSLGIPLALRKERPYRLEAEFTTERPSFEKGEEIVVSMTLTNTGEVPVQFETGGWQRGANRHARFTFQVTRDGELVPDTSRTTNWGGLGGWATLEPGEELVEQALLNRWVPPDTPGDYVVEATYELHIDGTPLPFDQEIFCSQMLDSYVEVSTGQFRFTVRE